VFANIRKRVTYTNVAMTIAVVFAMTGGAFAASKGVIITSKKQISSKVVKELTGKAGKAGPAGAAGAAGPVGATGPAGPAGSTGPSGPAGAKGETGGTGKDGKDGKEGSPWTAGGTLPSEKTETGVWGVSEVPGAFAGGIIEVATSTISFGIPLKEGLAKGAVHIIPSGGEGKGEGCPTGSTLAKPAAEPGNLCVFRGSPDVNVGTIETKSLETGEEEEAGTTGALLLLKPETKKEPILASGTWAVAAP
jgi:hypothetical protein